MVEMKCCSVIADDFLFDFFSTSTAIPTFSFAAVYFKR
ncbi:hypothetical protein SLEP1_g41172 [Rubroshorea leprosula]|uniref:Uncharacterized protein n=1 Tax=Rubroshorea leprosula TaxID=152421 RepID=A0AAV5L6Z7_9ROSI|nr:hypothetical protein SLEP1_g41172 [Rubroshorea leprosula]